MGLSVTCVCRSGRIGRWSWLSSLSSERLRVYGHILSAVASLRQADGALSILVAALDCRHGRARKRRPWRCKPSPPTPARSPPYRSTVDFLLSLVQLRNMYDPTFGPASLWRHLRKSDFRKYTSLKSAEARIAEIHKAALLGRRGFRTLRLSINNLSGNSIYQLTDLPSELVLRKAAENLRIISGTKQSNRFEIVSRLKLLCEEGLPFVIGKFDISQFYESIDRTHLITVLRRHLATAPATRSLLTSFLDQCNAQGINGLPRGLAISAELSELYMKRFDTLQRTDSTIHLFARYVDDIVVVTRPTNEFKTLRQRVIRRLPDGLKLNDRKTKLLAFGRHAKQNNIVEHGFDYLGFSFSVCHINKKSGHRKVVLDINDSKVKKRKTRIICSLLQFLKDGNLTDLRDRVKLITCNYRFYDHKNSQTRFAGNYHAYRPIDIPSKSLADLDDFLRKVILSNRGKISHSLSHSLTTGQRGELLRSSFRRGFEENIQFAFSPNRLKHLIDCWKYA